MKIFPRLAFLFFIGMILISSCHTHVFQNVKDSIQGKWTLQPIEPGSKINFFFDNGKLIITINDQPFQFIDENGATSTEIGYKVENNITNHHVIIDKADIVNYPVGWQRAMFTLTKKWLVIKSNDTELYLESIGENGLVGAYQLHFFRF